MRKPEPSAIPVAPEPPLAQAAEPPAQLSETPLVLPTEQGAYGSVASERSAAVSRAMSEAEAERTRRLRTEPITFTRRPGAREREAEQTKHFFSDARIRDGISEAVKKITGRLPNKEQIEKLAKGAGRKVSKAKVLGQPLPDFIAGAVLGGGAKQLARTGLAIAGVGGFGIAAGAGAVGGLAVEYYKLRKTVDMGETSETKGIRQGLKNELARLKAADRTKLRNAAIRGAISGAVGGVVGGLIMDHVDWGNIVHHVPGIGAAPGSPDIPQLAGAPAPGAGEAVAPTPSGTPTPGAEGITAPTPGAGVVETMPPAGPSTPEIPAGVGEEIVPAPEAGVAEAVTPAGPSSPPIAEVPETPEVESPMDISPKELATPPGPETIEIPAGSNPWVEVDKYLTDKLGRPPTTDEIERSVASLLSDNGIVDATKIPAGTVLNVEGVNQHIGEILGSAQLIPPDIAVLSESLPLPVNSDPWAEVSTLLEDLGRSHTNPEILGVARELCIQSKISVPEWGIVGDFDHRNLPAGFMLNFNDEVKRKIAQLALAS
ncbi:MAG: hypothetical protein HYU48_00630 [Candidatus Levybacteria bacterium]|nr:hypothetical protein [Candidatus Levybacteria bacterium]